MYFNILQLCAYIITWNVNTQLPTNSKVSLHNLLGIDANNNFNNNNFYDFNQNQNDQQNQNSNICTEPDLYVIGLQEVNSKPSNLITRLLYDDVWISKFRQILATKDYVTMKVQQMQGLLIVVFAKRKHLLHIRDIESDTTKTGFGGLWGNKGAVSIRMNLYGNSIAFINSHLPAHDDGLEKRIHDYHYIIDHHHYHVNHYRNIFDHDYVLWFGDLNFRLIDNSLKSKYIKNMIQDNRLDELFEKDQLSLVRNQNKAFQEFHEEQPKFSPTFKFHINTTEYNLQRRPAWTDRILYRIKEDTFYTNFPLKIQQLSYKSYPEYIISDHKPVTGTFKMNINDDPASQTFIQFSFIELWRLGEVNLIEYNIPDNYNEQDGDWIGIFPVDFRNLADYIAYEYASHSEKAGSMRQLRVEFSENVNFVENRDYILLYFQSSNTQSINGVVGMSNVFKAEK